MRYLLDVNALIALRHSRSPHHALFHNWAIRVGYANMLTCAHSELGFIRISMQVFGYSLEEAQDALATIREKLGGFVSDAPTPKLSPWASTAGRTSDAYLMQLATKNKLKLATFDGGIPGAESI